MITQKILLSIFSRLLVYAIQIIFGLIVARIVGPGVLGTVAFGLSYVSLFVFLADLGISTAHIKIYNENVSKGNCISTFTRLKLFSILLFTVVVISSILVQKYIYNYNFESEIHLIVILILLLSIIISEFFKIPQTTFIAKTEQAKQDIPILANNLLFQITKLISVLLGFKALGIAISQLISNLLVTPIYIKFYKGYEKGTYDKELAKRYITFSLPVIFVLISQTFIFWSDKVLLQYFTNSTELGYYSAAMNIAGILRLFENSLGLLFFPLITQLLVNHDYNRLKDVLDKYYRFLFLFVLPFICVLSFNSEIVVKILLGNQFLNSGNILKILVFAVFIPLIYLPLGNIILGAGYFSDSAKIWVLSAVFFLVTNFLLAAPFILNLKSLGTSSALLLANLFLLLNYFFFIKLRIKEVKLFQSKKLFIITNTFVIFSILIYNLMPRLKYEETFGLIYSCFFLVIYFSTLMLTKSIFKSDIYYLNEMLNLKKIKNYIKKEITLK